MPACQRRCRVVSLPSSAAPDEGCVGLAHDRPALRIERRGEPRPFLDETACHCIEPSIAAAAHGNAIRNASARRDSDLHGNGALIPAPPIVGVGGATANPLGWSAD